MLLVYYKRNQIILAKFFFSSNENKFYTSGGIATKIDEIKVFLSKENNYNINNDSFLKSQIIKKDINNKNISLNISYKRNEIKNDSDVQLTFEYIDSKEKLFLNIFFQIIFF